MAFEMRLFRCKQHYVFYSEEPLVYKSWVIYCAAREARLKQLMDDLRPLVSDAFLKAASNGERSCLVSIGNRSPSLKLLKSAVELLVKELQIYMYTTDSTHICCLLRRPFRPPC